MNRYLFFIFIFAATFGVLRLVRLLEALLS